MNKNILQLWMQDDFVPPVEILDEYFDALKEKLEIMLRFKGWSPFFLFDEIRIDSGHIPKDVPHVEDRISIWKNIEILRKHYGLELLPRIEVPLCP